MRTKLMCTLFILLLLGCKTLFAQGNLQINLLNDKCDSILIQTIAFFPFGSGSTCPPLVGYTLDTGSDTASVSLYYNASGVWQAYFCIRTDTIWLVVSPGTTTLIFQSFSITGSDTLLSPGAVSTIPICITGLTNISTQKDDILIQPNPVENIINIELPGRLKIKTISIYDVLGNLILKQGNGNVLDVSGLKPGIYLLSIETENKLYRKKFVKK